MKRLQELQSEIERVREELNVVAAKSVGTRECYLISIRLDKLIEDYMKCTEEEVRLRDCG